MSPTAWVQAPNPAAELGFICPCCGTQNVTSDEMALILRREIERYERLKEEVGKR